MSKTLSLIDTLLARGRGLQSIGRTQDALHLFGRLSGWRQLPLDTSEEILARLAEMELEHGNFAKARRHLTAVLACNPFNPTYHYQMATALDQDEEGDIERALDHYRQSLKLDPNQPRCLSEFGLAAISAGYPEEGLQALRDGAALAPDNPDIIGSLIEGLCELDKTEEARLTLQAALFRNSRNPAFQKLWSDFQFQQTWAEQQAGRRVALADQEVPGTRILPFIRPVRPPDKSTRKQIRKDLPSPLSGPRSPNRSSSPGRKHA